MITECIKRDRNSECACEHAEADIPRGRFVCNHECVQEMNRELEKARAEIYRLNVIINKYRDAFSPFVGVCRKVVEAADARSERTATVENNS